MKTLSKKQTLNYTIDEVCEGIEEWIEYAISQKQFDSGLCEIIREVTARIFNEDQAAIYKFRIVYKELMNTWPEKSGSYWYPVFIPDENSQARNSPHLLAHDQFQRHCAYGNMFHGAYGVQRIKLAEWIIDGLQEYKV